MTLPEGYRLERLVENGEDRLQLTRDGDESKPVYIDFTESGQSARQIRKKLARSNPLFRALGHLKDTKTVWDFTAGFGQDAFYMAMMGYHVVAHERSPVLFALLENAYERVMKLSDFAEALGDRLQFRHADSRSVLGSDEIPDAVYLDPMYPEKKKSALPRKEMRWLRDLVGEDETGRDLLELALLHRVRRVIVKRPIKGEPLSGTPAHSFRGQSTRYDLYLS